MSRTIYNPFHTDELATASTDAPTTEKDKATASALSNMDSTSCPKCGVRMGRAYLPGNVPVSYCDTCRVTHPTE